MVKLFSTLAIALLLTGCFGQRSERDEALNVEKIQYPMPEGGKVINGTHGEEVWFAYGAMAGVEDIPANGVAQAHQFEDGLFLHTVSLNVTPTEDGYFYQGWLLDGEELIPTGQLTNNFGDSRHGLRFEEMADYKANLQVVVTLEADDGNPAPGKRVAEGTMKVTQRR